MSVDEPHPACSVALVLRRFSVTGLVLFASACGRVGFDPRTSGAVDAAPSDVTPDGAPDAAPLGPFGPPTLIPALSHVSAFDDDPSLTGDMLELYFNSNRPGGAGGTDIWVSKRPTVLAPWGAPVLVTELSSASAEETPEVTADGLTLRLSSNRGGGLGGYDILESTRATRNDAWSFPGFVTEINTPSFDGCANASTSERVLVLCSGPTAQVIGLRASSRSSPADPWGTPVPISELDVEAYQSDPYLDGSGLNLVFAAGPTNQETNLFEASRPDITSPFGPRRSIGELDAADRDDGPWLSSDLRTIVFASRRDGNMEIYEARR